MRVNDADLAWAAGLLIGEGCVGRVISRNSSGTFEYICIQLSMYDERAVKRFAAIIGCSYQSMWHKQRQHAVFKVMVRARPAERILSLLWPYISDTDKGDQALMVATKLGIAEWITGERTGAREQLNRARRGRRKENAGQCVQ